MNELIAISALIGDRSYRIKIRPEDEEVVRRTLKIVNDKIIEFKTQFAGKDMQWRSGKASRLLELQS